MFETMFRTFIDAKKTLKVAVFLETEKR